jgi:hypothetical protein
MTRDVAQDVDALSAWLTQLESAVANGETPDLTGFDAEVQKVCDQVAAEPQATIDELQPLLSELLAGMDRLEAQMRDQFEGIRAELQSHGRRSQANRAYAQWMPSNAPHNT